MEPHRSISNSIVKGYSGENTERGTFWKDNTMSKFVLILIKLYYMTAYAIIEASGKQFWIEENRFYDFAKLPLNEGEMFLLNKILLINKHGQVKLGKPFLTENCRIEATVVRHLSGPKINVYKMRPKKKTRKKFGYRPKFTRVLINSIISESKFSSVGYL